MTAALDDILGERQRQHDQGCDFEDNFNDVNDFIALATAYLGRAASGSRRNLSEGLNPREMLVKAAALALAAIETLDERGFDERGW